MEKRGISVEGWSIAAAFLCLAVFGGVTAAAERRRRKELMERMERMLEALGNLVDNAIKYTESGSVRVSVTE